VLAVVDVGPPLCLDLEEHESYKNRIIELLKIVLPSSNEIETVL
jgi:hypothetical protein